MGALALISIIDVAQNDVKGLSQFGIFWLHLKQYQRGGVQLVLMIPFSYLMGYQTAYL